MGHARSTRPAVLGAALLLCLCPTRPAVAGGARPFFSTGLSVPVSYEDAGVGLGFTAGIENEVDSRTSLIFRADLEMLRGPQAPGGGVRIGAAPVDAPDVGFPVDAPDLRFATTALGVRFVAASGSPLRAYADALLGARIGLEQRIRTVPYGDRPDVRHEGVVGALRLGLTSAPRGGPGLFADAGWEFVLRNPGRFGVIPVRFGITLP